MRILSEDGLGGRDSVAKPEIHSVHNSTILNKKEVFQSSLVTLHACNTRDWLRDLII